MQNDFFKMPSRRSFDHDTLCYVCVICNNDQLGGQYPNRKLLSEIYSIKKMLQAIVLEDGVSGVRGIAKELLSQIIDVAEQNSMHTIIAGIDADNNISLELHRQYGFKEIGHVREVGYKFDKWLDLKFLQMILKTPADLPRRIDLAPIPIGK